MLAEKDLEIPFPPKEPIRCHLVANDSTAFSRPPSLIFTHGAGGTIKADAVVNFANGFAAKSSLLCFQGTMNLKSRVKMFSTVIEAQKSSHCLGGRSMGARAAVMAATDQTTHLVLVSYPLQSNKETRDQILLKLPDSMKIVFVIGDRDSMCDLPKLQAVRRRMKCRSWLLIVKSADHGMNARPKSATKELGEKTGDIVAQWLETCDNHATEGMLVWNADESELQWSGWGETQIEEPSKISAENAFAPPQTRTSKRTPKRTRHTETKSSEPEQKVDDSLKNQRKRRKR